MRTDGRINIAIDVDGKEVEQGRRSVQGLEKDARKVKGGADQASGGIKNISSSLALVKIGASAFNVLASSMDSAINRFDTFQTFPSVMSALGESTEDSERAIDNLSNGIDGLPTKLDDIVNITQRLYGSFKDLDESTDTALALNNAMLASASSAGDAQRGSEQYIQALQKGNFEMDEWKTLQETMGVGLTKIAESFGMTERELKDALDSGIVSMDDFNDRMIELGTGTGELANLAKINSQTLETAFTNLRNTASRGLADIIEAFNDMSKEVSGKSLAENLESLKGVVNSAFKAISNTIRALAPVVTTLVTAFRDLRKIMKPLEPLTWGLVAAYTALLTIRKVNSILDNNKKALEGLSIVTALLTREMHGKTIAQLASTNATTADHIAQIASNTTLTAKNIILGVLTGQLQLSTAATYLKAEAVTVLNGVMTALSGPIGWVITGVGLAVTAFMGWRKWMSRTTEEGEKLAKQTDELAESTNALTDEVDSNNKEFEKQIRRTEASTEANIDLAQRVSELSSQENLNSKEKKELQENIELLNREVEGLNVAYDEEAEALNMSSIEMQKRIELMGEEEKLTAARERQIEITREQHEADMQLRDIIKLRIEYHERILEGLIGHDEYTESIAGLDEQEKQLAETQRLLAIQYETTEEVITESMENRDKVAEVLDIEEKRRAREEKKRIEEQILIYEELEDSVRGTVDSMRESYQSLQEAATNAFEKIETKSEHTMASMIETLKHNQKAVEDWGQNQAKLMEWAGKNGYDNLIPYIESLGIDSAAELAVMANATDEQMTEFAEAMGDTGVAAHDGFMTAYDMSEEDFKAIEHMVTDMDASLRTQIKEADFANIGKEVTDGMAEGVAENAVQAIDAAGNMADDMTRKTKQTLQIHSPSKVFTEIGKDVADGLARGVLKNIRTVAESLKQVAKNMPLVFDNTPRQFRTIGQQAITGLVWGLNNGRSRVMSTARDIANSVARTMQDALKIKSPSGVMRDDVGRWIPEGVAEGIEKSSNAVYDAIEKMNVGMLRASTPELALGVTGRGFAGSNISHISSTNNKNTTHHDNATVINIEKIENHTDSDIPRILEESAWIMRREGSRLGG